MTNTPMTFEQWFEKQYGKKPMPVVKQGDEPHDSVYMTMFADGAFRGWQACEQQNQTVIAELVEALEDASAELSTLDRCSDYVLGKVNQAIAKVKESDVFNQRRNK